MAPVEKLAPKTGLNKVTQPLFQRWMTRNSQHGGEKRKLTAGPLQTSHAYRNQLCIVLHTYHIEGGMNTKNKNIWPIINNLVMMNEGKRAVIFVVYICFHTQRINNKQKYILSKMQRKLTVMLWVAALSSFRLWCGRWFWLLSGQRKSSRTQAESSNTTRHILLKWIEKAHFAFEFLFFFRRKKMFCHYDYTTEYVLSPLNVYITDVFRSLWCITSFFSCVCGANDVLARKFNYQALHVSGRRSYLICFK